MLKKYYKYILVFKTILLFIALGIFGVLQIYYQDAQSVNTQKKIVFILDISHSMNAADALGKYDIPMTRLELGKNIIQKIIQDYKDTEYGLIIFSQQSNYYIPPTYDTDTLLTYLTEINTYTLPAGGTNISSALDLFVQNTSGALGIMISDFGGAQAMQTQLPSIQKLKSDKNISDKKLLFIGIGSSEGDFIYYPDGKQVYDDDGNEVQDARNDDFAKTIANVFDTQYVIANNYEIVEQDQFNITPTKINNISDTQKLIMQISAALFAILGI